jgi:hypothetical protein
MRDFQMRAAQALLLLIGTSMPAMAADGFDIVIPGRPGVPIIINGKDASYAVVVGDWGLGRSIHVQPTVYGGRPFDPEPAVGHYYPSAGSLPGYGRLEIEPPANRTLPQPAESYHESVTVRSAPPARQPEAVPFYPPAVIQAPRAGAQAPQAGAPQAGAPQAGAPQAGANGAPGGPRNLGRPDIRSERN